MVLAPVMPGVFDEGGPTPAALPLARVVGLESVGLLTMTSGSIGLGAADTGTVGGASLTGLRDGGRRGGAAGAADVGATN